MRASGDGRCNAIVIREREDIICDFRIFVDASPKYSFYLTKHTSTMNLRAFFSLLLCVGMTTAAQAQPITAGEHTRVTTVYGPIDDSGQQVRTPSAPRPRPHAAESVDLVKIILKS